MKQRKQTLYQAIMEGGHSLPEQEVAQEEITDFNTEDPMNSVIAIRGIGTMSISSALEKVSEMAMDIAKLGAMKDAKNVQDNLPRYMDLLATYNESIQEAYRELAQQRKRGGTASRGIDKDITEELSDEEMDAFHVELDKLVHKYFGHSSDEKQEMDEGDFQDTMLAQKAIPHILKQADTITSRLGPKYGNMYLQNHSTTFSKAGVKIPNMNRANFKIVGEHCGDPMADDHKPMRMLLMKLYQKEMQCQPGSPEHFEVMQMIDGCRKNIGLEEGVLDNIKNYVKDQVAQRKATLSGKKNETT